MAAPEFVEMLRALQNQDNAIRNAAEKRYTEARTQQAGPTIVALFGVLAEAALEETVCEQAAVLLRQCLGKVKEETSTWSTLGASVQAECKMRVLQLFEAEGKGKVRKKEADIIQSLGNQLIDIDNTLRPQNVEVWPELMPTLMRLVLDTTKDPGLRADAMWIVSELMDSVWQVLLCNKEQILHILKSCLVETSEALVANTASMFCELISHLDDKSERKYFSSLVSDFCNVLRKLADSASNEHLNSVLSGLEGEANHVLFFKESFASEIMPVLCPIAKAHKENETRRLALETIVSFAECKPKTLSKVPGYIQQTLDISVQFLMELDEDLKEWASQADDEAEDEENFTHGKEVIDRLCRCMNKAEQFPLLMETLKPAIITLVQSADWKQVTAGITVLSQMAEYIEEETIVLQMVKVIQGQMHANHIRTRHAAWSAFGQFAEDHQELLTNDTMAPELLPEFLTGLDDQCNRVLERCMEAFQIYGQAVNRELIESFVPVLMEKTCQKLQSTELQIQRKAVTFIAVIAGQMEDGFAPYYALLMPVLKQIIQNMLHNVEERVLLGKAFECISLLAKAVGQDGFRADAEGIMKAMIDATQVPNLPSNDPVKEYMLEASQRICATMKADFLPFVPHILPGILEKFTLAPKELNADTRAALDDDDEVNLALVPSSDGQMKVMVMSTSEMEDMQNAIDCVHTFVEELGKFYAPYVTTTAQALLPVFEFAMSEEVRDLAFETWGQLCHSAREAGEAHILSELVNGFLGRILPKLENQGTSPPDAEAKKTSLDGMKACLTEAGPGVLGAEQVRHVCQVAFNELRESFKRREEAKKKPNLPADDEDDAADDDEDEEDENVMRISCCELVGALMEHHADIFMAEVMQQCLPLALELMQPSVAVEDRRLGIFIFCDMLKHLGARVTPQWPQFMPQMIQDVLHPKPELRQPACYGLSLAAMDPAFSSYAQAASTSLVQVITEARSRAKKKSEKPAQACADNALSALVEILRCHQQAVAQAEGQMWNVWLQGLPCQEDSDEGKKNHKILLELIKIQKREVVGDGGANLPHVLSILVDVYKTDMVDENTSKGIGQLVLQVGGERLEQAASNFKDQRKRKLQRILREAQQNVAA